MKSINYRGYEILVDFVGKKFHADILQGEERWNVITGIQEQSLINKCKDWIDKEEDGDDYAE